MHFYKVVFPIFIQLIAHRIFSSREVRELKDLVVELPADEVATKAVARVSRDDGSKEMHAYNLISLHNNHK